ncbi:hypothetical protein BD01_1832 [Thermococcus nautili]|uniref:Uncharacterized protein n=1 Tax=Thermococcus nautili TaxID=195522 RepID=W8P797_9EURY|nr:hypothetical protein BD01_1832 [Thermococcus nautili]
MRDFGSRDPGSNPGGATTTKDKGAPPPYLSVLSNPWGGASPHNPVFFQTSGGLTPPHPKLRLREVSSKFVALFEKPNFGRFS